MIKLHEININGFKNEKTSIRLQFSKEPSSVIFGDNGCGKTTFLKILQSVLSGDESTLLSEEVSTVSIKYSYSNDNSLNRVHDEVSISKVINEYDSDPEHFQPIDLFSKEQHYDWKDFHNSHLSQSRSISLGVDRGYASPRLGTSSQQLMKFIQNRRSLRNSFRSLAHINEFAIELSDFLSSRSRNTGIFAKTGKQLDHISLKEVNMKNVGETLSLRYRSARRNAATRVQSALFDTLSVAIFDKNLPKKTESNDFSYDLIFKNKELIIEALDDSQENKFKDTIILQLKKLESKEDIENLQKNELLINLLMKMAEELKDSEEELFAVNTVIDKFDSFTSQDKTLKITLDEVLVKSKSGTHTIDELSSGERHILTLLTLLLDQGRGRDFIIIDEPEISLNTRWQEILLPTLSEILPSSQIIVASHSPIIAESVDNLVEIEVI